MDTFPSNCRFPLRHHLPPLPFREPTSDTYKPFQVPCTQAYTVTAVASATAAAAAAIAATPDSAQHVHELPALVPPSLANFCAWLPAT
jgi:hypothetical protein